MSEPTANLADLPEERTPEVAVSGRISWGEVWVVLAVLAAVGAAGGQWLRQGAGAGFLPALALVTCILAAAFDTAIARIPNPLTYSAVLLGLGLNGLGAGAAWVGMGNVSRWLGAVGPTEALAGFGLCAGIGLLCMFTAGMGGGDMKLLAALGAMLGLTQVSSLLLYSLIAAVTYSLVNLLISGRLNALLRSVAAQLLIIVCLRQPAAIEPPSKTTIPLAIPLLVGLVVWRLLGS